MEIISKLREDMQLNSSEENIETTKRYFKKSEQIKVCGLKSAQVRALAKKHMVKIPGCAKKELFDYCEILFSSGVMEESFVACDWLRINKKHFLPEDFKIFEFWVDNYINNWASCDSICSWVTGEFILMYPEFVEELKIWAKSDNKWMKRAAAVSLVLPVRRGQQLDRVFEIADILLLDKDDMVQKGYGWMLKVAGDHIQKEVFDYVVKNKAVMPRTALRYAIEKMPQDLRKEEMKK